MKRRKQTSNILAAGSRSIPVALCCVLFCIVVLTSITYAWFQHNVRALGNELVIGSYSVETTVTKSGGEESVDGNSTGSGADNVISPNEGIYVLSAGESYKVTFTASGDVSTGYATMTASALDEEGNLIKEEDTSKTLVYTIPIELIKNEDGNYTGNSKEAMVTMGDRITIAMQSEGEENDVVEVAVAEWQISFSSSWGYDQGTAQLLSTTEENLVGIMATAEESQGEGGTAVDEGQDEGQQNAGSGSGDVNL